MDKAEMIRKMTAAGIDLETALDIALAGKEPEKQPEKKEPEKQPEKKEPEKQPEKKEQPAGITQEMGSQLLAAITKLTGAVQRSNILSVGSDDEPENQQDKVDKLLTRILSGERKEGSNELNKH